MIRTDATAAPLTRPDGTPIRILAVDDESSLTELLSMAMRYEGWHVSTAASGGQAVKVARNQTGCHRARHDAAGLRWPRGDAPHPVRGSSRAGDLPHRKGLGRRSDRRPHRRRRRLRHQAIQPGGGHRPATRPASAQRRRARQKRLDSLLAISPSTRTATRCDAAAWRSS